MATLKDEQKPTLDELDRLKKAAKAGALSGKTAVELVRLLVLEHHRTQRMLNEANDWLVQIHNRAP